MTPGIETVLEEVHTRCLVEGMYCPGIRRMRENVCGYREYMQARQGVAIGLVDFGGKWWQLVVERCLELGIALY